MLSELLRPYYDAETFNAGYLAVFRPGVGVFDVSSGQPIASGIVSSAAAEALRGLRGLALLALRLLTLRVGIHGAGAHRTPLRNVYADLELSEYFEWRNIEDLGRKLLGTFFRNYCRVLVSQPVEVCRILLQVGQFGPALSPRRFLTAAPLTQLVFEDDEVDYFHLPSGPTTPVRSRRSLRIEYRSDVLPQVAAPAQPTRRRYVIDPTSRYTLDIMSAIVQQEGLRGLWRGLNASFIHSTLLMAVEAWFTGLLAPLLLVPDPFFWLVSDLPDPFKLVLLSIGACVAAGVVLAPLDLIRTRLIVTLTRTGNRSIREFVRGLGSYYVPMRVLVPSALYALVGAAFRRGTPYLLFTRFGTDSVLSPATYALANMALQVVELFVRLPVETMLRRVQVDYLLDPAGIHPSLRTDGDDLAIAYAPRRFWELAPKDYFHGWRLGMARVLGNYLLEVVRSSQPEEERL